MYLVHLTRLYEVTIFYLLAIIIVSYKNMQSENTEDELSSRQMLEKKQDTLNLRDQKSPVVRGLMETSRRSGANLPYFIWLDETRFINVILAYDRSIRSLDNLDNLSSSWKEIKGPSLPSLANKALYCKSTKALFWQDVLSGLCRVPVPLALCSRVGAISSLQHNSVLQETRGSAYVQTTHSEISTAVCPQDNTFT